MQHNHAYLIRSGSIREVVRAHDQWAAWDTLKGRALEEFGLIAIAERDENGDPIPVQTATLMLRWGRIDDVIACNTAAARAGLIASDNEV